MLDLDHVSDILKIQFLAAPLNVEIVVIAPSCTIF